MEIVDPSDKGDVLAAYYADASKVCAHVCLSGCEKDVGWDTRHAGKLSAGK